jgi:hypothetical protein
MWFWGITGQQVIDVLSGVLPWRAGPIREGAGPVSGDTYLM